MTTLRRYVKLGAVVATTAAVCAISYLSYVSPLATLKRIEQAAKSNDRDRLRELINFEAIKTDLKEDLKVQMLAEPGPGSKSNPLMALGPVIASMAIDPMIDAIVSPSGITRLINHAQSGLPKEREAVEANIAERTQSGYDEFSRYRIRVRPKNSPEPLVLTLKREGLFSWKLTGILIPPNFWDGPASPAVVGLQRRSDLISIESSDLQSAPDRPGVIVLTALLENKAPFAQEYPDWELSLTDSQDNPVVRRVFTPVEYLQSDQRKLDAGMEGGSKQSLRILLEVNKPAIGYQLFIFFKNEDLRPANRQIDPQSIKLLPR